MKFAPLGTVCHQDIEGCRQHTEVANVHAIKVKESKEGAEFLKCGRPFPISDTVNFNGVHGNAIFTDNDTKVFNLCGFELALLQFEVEVIIGKDLKDVVNDSSV